MIIVLRFLYSLYSRSKVSIDWPEYFARSRSALYCSLQSSYTTLRTYCWQRRHCECRKFINLRTAVRTFSVSPHYSWVTLLTGGTCACPKLAQQPSLSATCAWRQPSIWSEIEGRLHVIMIYKPPYDLARFIFRGGGSLKAAGSSLKLTFITSLLCGGGRVTGSVPEVVTWIWSRILTRAATKNDYVIS